MLGIIENLSYAQPGRMTRMAFGIGYPTDFGAHVLFLLLCYFYLRRKKNTICGIGNYGSDRRTTIYIFAEQEQMRCVSGCWQVSFSIPKSEETMQKKGKKSMRWHHGFLVCLHRQEPSVLRES